MSTSFKESVVITFFFQITIMFRTTRVDWKYSEETEKNYFIDVVWI